jgi:molybdopterin synthase catalytic subunit
MLRITDEPISLAEVAQVVMHPSAGAVATFAGTTRDSNGGRVVLRLEYEAYPEMAVAEFAKIEARIRERWEVVSVAIVHRTGIVPIGQISVAIAVSAPHRRDAIEACHFAIDELKLCAPIWKKEHYEGGEVWIGSLADCAHEAADSRRHERGGQGAGQAAGHDHGETPGVPSSRPR